MYLLYANTVNFAGSAMEIWGDEVIYSAFSHARLCVRDLLTDV